MLLLAGCTPIAAIAAKMSTTKVAPSYVGLKDQSVGVMVDASRGTRNDWPSLQLDVAQGVQKKLQGAQKAGADELKGTKFPPDRGPDAMYAFQRNNPGLMFEPITTVAPKLGVSRLIYIEVEDFTLHPEQVPELFRGVLSARVQVIEVPGPGQPVKKGYVEKVSAVFPPNAPPEGRPGLTDPQTYIGTVDAFTTEVLKKFVTYEEGS